MLTSLAAVFVALAGLQALFVVRLADVLTDAAGGRVAPRAGGTGLV